MIEIHLKRPGSFRYISSIPSVLAAALVLSTAMAGTAQVPAAYQDIYTLDTQQIGAFKSTIQASWNGQSYPVNYSSQLKSAAAENGPQILVSTYYTGVINELDSLQSLGAKSVTIHLDFPILDPGYTSQWPQYLAFYQQLASDVHARGLKLIVENQIIFPQPGVTSLNCQQYYNSLTWSQYENKRAAMSALIASQIKPEYLSVITEPDTEAANSGKSQAGTSSGSAEMLTIMLTDIAATHTHGVQVGAGVGTWLGGFQQFIQAYVATSVNYIDMHIYPPNETFLTNAITIANMATNAGKTLGISEFWASKQRDSELGQIKGAAVDSRNTWSFWQPIDAMFFQTLSEFAQWQHLDFISPFWTTYFHATLDYNLVNLLTPEQMMQQSSAATQAAAQAGQVTPTAMNWKNDVASDSDSQGPSAPTGLSGVATQTQQVNLQWLASTDDVGVLGYIIYRDGVKQATVGSGYLYYQDFGLAPSTTYHYTLIAYDAAGHTSAPSVPLAVSTR